MAGERPLLLRANHHLHDFLLETPVGLLLYAGAPAQLHRRDAVLDRQIRCIVRNHMASGSLVE